MTQISSGLSKRLGTTIDDSAALAALASCIAASPDLSVPQAVRKIGYTDQAAIRRIGNKYRTQQKSGALKISLTANKALSGDKADTLQTETATMASSSSRAMPLASQPPKIRKSKPASKDLPKSLMPKTIGLPEATTAATAQTVKPATAPQVSAQSDFMPGFNMQPWLGASMKLSNSAIANQAKLAEQMMRVSPLTALMRQQLQLSQMMFSMFTKSPFALLPPSTKKR